MECAVKVGKYPTGFVQQMVVDVTTALAEGAGEETNTTKSNTLSLFNLTVTKLCKVHISHTHTTLHMDLVTLRDILTNLDCFIFFF